MDKVSACTSQTAGGSTLNRNNTGNSNSGQAVPPITERNRSRQSSHDLELKQDCFLTEINSTEFPYNFHALWHTVCKLFFASQSSAWIDKGNHPKILTNSVNFNK